MAAFTLLELVLVMVIICAVLAMAAPSLRGFFASRQTADAAARLISLTQFARAQAAAEGNIYRLNLDAEQGRYWLTVQRAGAFAVPQSEFGRIFLLPDGTSAQWVEPAAAGTTGWVAFYPDGRAEACRLRLTGRKGDGFDVVCRSPAEPFEAVGFDAGAAP